jgi:SAM-dependent methyltransferase
MRLATCSHVSLDACPVCGAAQRESLFVKDGWPVARCSHCTMVYVDAVLNRAALGRIYDRDYYQGDVFADYLGEREVRRASGRARARALASLVPAGRLLDLGCAAGFFLSAASEFYDVTGVEVSAFAADHAREAFGLRVFTGEIFDARLADDEFDVVTMWDVIEHLTDPGGVLREVARVTRPEGLLVLTTGDIQSRLAVRDLERWDLMSPPAHLLFFSARTLERLLNQTGFEIERIMADGRISQRPRLSGARVKSVVGSLGVGNVITVFARRRPQPRPRALRARLPGRLQRIGRGR